MLERKLVDGVDRPLATGTDGPREWPGGFKLYVDGRGVVLFEVIDILVLGMLGVLSGLVTLVDRSEIGGEGGVCVSERPDDETVFPGGVSNEGVESVVVGEISERGEAEGGTVCSDGNCLLWSTFSSAFLNFSLTISASILRSDNSSRNRCVSIRKASLSCSPTLTSSSIITDLSIAMLYFDSISSSEDSVFLCWRS